MVEIFEDMNKRCVECGHELRAAEDEDGVIRDEWQAVCKLNLECMGMENWCPKGCLHVWDERKGRKFLK